MLYYGGKARNGRKIAQLIADYRRQGQPYLEPFCGSLSVTQHVSDDRTASDINGHLITTFKAMQNGWIPPEWITRGEYKLLQTTQDINDPLTAIAGILYSFGGAWFNGYVGDIAPTVCQSRTLTKKIMSCQNVKFQHCEYDSYEPVNQLIYCDPPYAGTNGYNNAPNFDHDKFWNVVRKWSENNTVLVSEYNAPADFKCIASFETWMSMKAKNNNSARIDRVFTLNDPPVSLFNWPS